jgi:hypothetical protein
MAHVKSTARYVDGGGSGGEGRESGGSEERTESARQSNVGSCSEASEAVDNTGSFFFGPSTVTVSRIRGMIDSGYFAEGMGHELGEDIVPEPNPDEVVVFEDFFTAGLRMPPHPVLADILLRFKYRYIN